MGEHGETRANTDLSEADIARAEAAERERRHAESGPVQDEPVLDGAEDHEDTDVDPRKGMSDPGLIRDVADGKKTTNPYG